MKLVIIACIFVMFSSFSHGKENKATLKVKEKELQEQLSTFSFWTQQKLTFGNFIKYLPIHKNLESFLTQEYSSLGLIDVVVPEVEYKKNSLVLDYNGREVKMSFNLSPKPQITFAGQLIEFENKSYSQISMQIRKILMDPKTKYSFIEDYVLPKAHAAFPFLVEVIVAVSSTGLGFGGTAIAEQMGSCDKGYYDPNSYFMKDCWVSSDTDYLVKIFTNGRLTTALTDFKCDPKNKVLEKFKIKNETIHIKYNDKGHVVEVERGEGDYGCSYIVANNKIVRPKTLNAPIYCQKKKGKTLNELFLLPINKMITCCQDTKGECPKKMSEVSAKNKLKFEQKSPSKSSVN